MIRVVRHRARDVAPRPADHRHGLAPADHPVVLGAGMAGLVAMSVMRRRFREPRDEQRVLGIGF